LRLLDDEKTIEPAVLLHHLMRVRMVPERARVRHLEAVIERPIRLDRVLREMRHAVHRILEANTMPVDRGRLADAVRQSRENLAALPDTDFRARHSSAVAPNGRGRALRQELCLTWFGIEPHGPFGRLGTQTAR